MSQWPDVAENDGYIVKRGKEANTGSVLWESNYGIPDTGIDGCKAVCNNNSRCKSVVFNKNNRVCYLKDASSGSGERNDSNIDTYYKNGNPLDGKKIYYTKEIGPSSNWKDNGLFCKGSSGCDTNSVRVGDVYNNRTNLLDSNNGQRTCSWVPKAKVMCPGLGDLRYFRHTDGRTQPVEDYDYNQRYTSTGTGQFGGGGGCRTDMHGGHSIVCGYNRIDKNLWPNLSDWFDNATKEKIIKEHCEGPGISSKELAADTTRCGSMMKSQTEYNVAILQKLLEEDEWWFDSTNCSNFRNVVVGNVNDQSVMRKAEEVVNDLPNTNWSDDLVRALNSIKTSVPATKNVIDAKIESYCANSDGDNNIYCGCRNAVKYGNAKTCKDNIEGCEDVKRAQDLIDKVTGIDANFGRTIQSIYDPNFDSEACKSSITPTSTVLNVGAMQVRNYDIAACFNAIENSGTISGDVSTKCNASVARYNSEQSSSKSSSSDSTGTTDEKIFISGETAGVRNDAWLVGLILCFMCFMIIGVGLAAVLL